MGDNYTQGAIDAIKTWGSACGTQASCDTCPVAAVRGTEVSCQEFAKQFPKKFLSLLRELDAGSISYAAEYHIRFPNQDLTAEELVQMGVCRKLIFEGYTGCDEGDCLECWNANYIGDVTMDANGNSLESNEEDEAF